MNPAAGTFLQRDPLGYVDGMNLYGYVKGNPLMYVDPYGSDSWITSWFGLKGTIVGDVVDDVTDVVVDGTEAILSGGEVGQAARAGFADAYSEAAYGTVGALTGGLIDSDYGFLGYKDEVLDAVGLEDGKAYDSGTYGARAFVSGTLAAGALHAIGVCGQSFSQGTLNLRLGVHAPHAGGPHQFWHFQANWWRQGIKGSGGAWRLPFNPTRWTP